MNQQPYCDYCGEVIHNYYKMEYGEDIAHALRMRDVRETKRISYLFLLALSVFIPFRTLVFCNQKHKDLFAKKVGLKIIHKTEK